MKYVKAIKKPQNIGLSRITSTPIDSIIPNSFLVVYIGEWVKGESNPY
jgi:hypothetical protein